MAMKHDQCTHPATAAGRAACRKQAAGPTAEVRNPNTGRTRAETKAVARASAGLQRDEARANARNQARGHKPAGRLSQATRDRIANDADNADARYLAKLSDEADTRPRPAGSPRIITEAESREFWAPRNAAFKAEMDEAQATGRCRACGRKGHLNCPGR